eukprot:GHVN01041146.1.p1 GENE.GHVN01041146.1~~GHVN01041146.1.p1  ORF type:complete len:785 (+),score=195.69 GHVN01041146.1:187-2355(+)
MDRRNRSAFPDDLVNLYGRQIENLREVGKNVVSVVVRELRSKWGRYLEYVTRAAEVKGVEEAEAIAIKVGKVSLRTGCSDERSVYCKDMPQTSGGYPVSSFIDFVGLNTVSKLWWAFKPESQSGDSNELSGHSGHSLWSRLSSTLLDALAFDHLTQHVGRHREESEERGQMDELNRDCGSLNEGYLRTAVTLLRDHLPSLISPPASPTSLNSTESDMPISLNSTESVMPGELYKRRVMLINHCSALGVNRYRYQGAIGYAVSGGSSNDPLPNKNQALLLELWSRLDILCKSNAELGSFMGQSEGTGAGAGVCTGKLSSRPSSATEASGAINKDISSHLSPTLALYLSDGGFVGAVCYIISLTTSSFLDIFNSFVLFDDSVDALMGVDLKLNAEFVAVGEEGVEGERTPLLNVGLNNTSRGPHLVERGWSDLATGTANYVVSSVRGVGSAFIRVAMKFIQNDKVVYPTFKGLLVQKKMYRYDRLGKGCGGSEEMGTAVPVADRGELWCVEVKVTSKEYINGATVIDLLPGGFEAVEEVDETISFAWGSSLRPTALIGGWWMWFRRCRSPDISHTTGTLQWRCDYIPAGSTTFHYTAIANLPGLYAFPAATAYSTQHPEIMGMSGGVERVVTVSMPTNFHYLGKGINGTVIDAASYEFLSKRGQPKPCKLSNSTSINLTSLNSTSLNSPQSDDGCGSRGSCNPSDGKCYRYDVEMGQMSQVVTE